MKSNRDLDRRGRLLRSRDAWNGLLMAFTAALLLAACGESGAPAKPDGAASSSVSDLEVKESSSDAGSHTPDAGTPTSFSEQPFRIGWAFGGIVGDQFVTIADRTTLNSGTELRMQLRLSEAVSVFVVAETSDNEVSFVFPRAEKDFVIGDQLPRTFWLMDRGSVLDESEGEERIHLVAAKEPIASLAGLAREGFDLPGEARSKDGDWGRRVLTEMQRLKRDNMGLSAATARPVQIGGALRGAEPEPKHVELEGVGFLYRRFTIDHR